VAGRTRWRAALAHRGRAPAGRAAGAKLFGDTLAVEKNEFAARNASQVYALRDVSLLFVERLIAQRFLRNIDEAEHDRNAAAGPSSAARTLPPPRRRRGERA